MLNTLGKFGYQGSNVIRSVISSGNVYHHVHMDQYTNYKTNTTGMDDIIVEKTVYNARNENATLDRSGVCLVKNSNFNGINFLDHDEICTKYYHGLENFILSTVPNAHKVS